MKKTSLGRKTIGICHHRRNQMKTTQFTKAMISACFLMLGITLNAQTQDSATGWGRARLAHSRQSNASPVTATNPIDQAKPSPPTSILGTWHVTGTIMDAPYEVLMTFLPGDSPDQGAVIFTSNQDQGPPFSGTAGTGNWTRVGPFSFIATHLTFLFDVANVMPAGLLKIVDAITLNGDQIKVNSQLTFPATLCGGCDPFSLQTTGSRVAIEAPPAGQVTVVVNGANGVFPNGANTFQVTSNLFGLDASKSMSSNAGGLSYSWAVISAGSAGISYANTATPLIQLIGKGTFQLSVTVTDANGISVTQAITIQYV
ncbi:MAG TPA: hypothetical protein VKV15_03040 [Bryobacteraceae bacterium]|nr:hypothetical protein [Bryobacteraceae bacterium]